MCQRTTRDPLLRTLIDRYHLHLLAIPRENADVGDLYVETAGQLSTPGNMRHLLEPEFTLPAVERAEPMAHVSGHATRGIDAKLGLDLLDSTLAAYSGGAFAGSVRGAYDNKGAKQLHFRFEQPTRDSVDILAFGQHLSAHRLVACHPLVTPKSRFYVVTAVARATSILVGAATDSDHRLQLDLAAVQQIKLPVGWKLAQTAASEIQYTGSKPLAFGVELHELRYDRERGALELSVPRKPMRVRGSEVAPDGSAQTIDSRAPAWIGDHDADVLLRLSG